MILIGVKEAILLAIVVSSFATASFLTRNYLHNVMQLTKDCMPVLFTN